MTVMEPAPGGDVNLSIYWTFEDVQLNNGKKMMPVRIINPMVGVMVESVSCRMPWSPASSSPPARGAAASLSGPVLDLSRDRDNAVERICYPDAVVDLPDE